MLEIAFSSVFHCDGPDAPPFPPPTWFRTSLVLHTRTWIIWHDEERHKKFVESQKQSKRDKESVIHNNPLTGVNEWAAYNNFRYPTSDEPIPQNKDTAEPQKKKLKPRGSISLETVSATKRKSKTPEWDSWDNDVYETCKQAPDASVLSRQNK